MGDDPLFDRHQPGGGHPERPERLAAVRAAFRRVGVDDSLRLEPRDATLEEMQRVHSPEHLETVRAMAAGGGGRLDPDTAVSPESWDVAIRAAGTGLAAIDALAGGGGSAFCAVRPPGHHALARRAMGFCLVNNAAIAAAALSAAGERVLLFDWDAHHGNGSQAIFERDPSVLYISLHEWPLYPGTGAADEIGIGDGEGYTVNMPVPAGATGDVFLAAFDDVVAPLAQRFEPTWVLVSAGYDAHRADPLTGLALTAGDFAALTTRVEDLAGPAPTVYFLEGGYDLEALADSVAATLGVVLGEPATGEKPSHGGPGRSVIAAAARRHGL